MRNFDFEDLRIVQAVVNYGGVTQAARMLHRVPSNISTRIKQLEYRLECTLFERQGRSLRPTEQGMILVSYAERLLKLAEETQTALTTGKSYTPLRLGSTESTAASQLPTLLAQFHQCHPDISIELTTGATDTLIDKVMRYELEAAFVSEPFHAPGLTTQAVFKEELVLISAVDDHTLDTRKHHPLTLLTFSAGCAYRRRLEQWQQEQGLRIGQTQELASYAAIVACVAAGVGVAMVPRSIIDTSIYDRAIRRHPLPNHLAVNRTHLIWHTDSTTLSLSHLCNLLSINR